MTALVIIAIAIATIAGIWFVIWRLDEGDRKIERLAKDDAKYWGEP